MALAAYAEPLADGRRVIVFGDSSSGLAEHLVERGARLVHVYDPDAMRVAEAATRNTSRNISYGPLAEGALAVRDGAFDVGIVENLALVGDASSALRRLRRALSPRAAALVALPNPDVSVRLLPAGPSGELDYYRLYDLVAEHFEHVRMLGQTPFVGYAVADFAAGGVPEPSLDTAFVPGGAEEPEWFIALASSVSIHLDEFAVIQLPFRHALPGAQTRELEAEVSRARAAEHRARERMAALEAEHAALVEQARRQGAAEADREKIGALEQQLAKRDAWIQELETRLTIADARADEAQAELEEQRERSRRPEPPRAGRPELDASRRQVDALRQELEALRRELDAVLAERETAKEGAAALQRSLAERDAQLAELSEAEADGAEVAGLEQQLRERGAEIRKLEGELRGAEVLGRELLRELEAAHERSAETAGPARPDLRQRLDELAELNARREADLTAARWSIEALEARLTEAEGSAERGRELAQALQQAEARVQEQATLIEQLRGAH